MTTPVSERREDRRATTARRAGSSRTPRTAAAVPAVKPADRSISPSSRTNTRPIARTMIARALGEQVGEVALGQDEVRLQDREHDRRARSGRGRRAASPCRRRAAGRCTPAELAATARRRRSTASGVRRRECWWSCHGLPRVGLRGRCPRCARGDQLDDLAGCYAVAGTCAAIWPRYRAAIAVRDLRRRRSCCARSGRRRGRCRRAGGPGSAPARSGRRPAPRSARRG